ncbi:PPE family protein [Mycobacterium intracellulare MOTT-02]|nr:PPE family protein [Mycobacterium intracellulare MOTT-02]
MLDYGAFPPEFNSARIYSGPGSGSLVSAASAWSALAAELNSAALSYEKVVTALSSEEWLGAASATMAQAVQPYIAWMTSAAAQAEEAATQARAAAAAYEAALSASVPPPLVASNRMQVSQLQATNVLGQNTPLIAQLEAQYGEYWAQDAGAMYGYAGQSSAATKQTPFQKAPEITNASGQATQSAAVTKATTDSTATNTSKVLQSMAQPASNATANATAQATTATDPLTELWFLLTGQTTLPTSLGTAVNGYTPFAGLFYNTEGLPYFSIGMGNNFVQISKSLGLIGSAAPAAAKALPALGVWAGCSVVVRPRRIRWRRWAVRPRSGASCRCRWPGRGRRRRRRRSGMRSRSAPSARLPRPPAGPETCSGACRWPVPAPAGTAWPAPNTASDPPSWPDHPSRAEPRP